MGMMDLIPFLGTDFYAWTPLIILLPSGLAFFRIIERTLRAFGLGRYGYENAESDEFEASRWRDEDGETFTEHQSLAANGATDGGASGGRATIEEGRRLIDEGKRRSCLEWCLYRAI